MNAQRTLMVMCGGLLLAALGIPFVSADQGGAKPGGGSSSPKPAAAKQLIPGPGGLRFGITSESVAKLYDRVFDADFVPRYKKVQPGPSMDALDNELSERKAELRRRTEFGDTPVALENTPLRSEFSYENDESMTHTKLTRTLMNADLKSEREVGYHRYFFYFGDKLWKIYDEYKVGAKGLYDSYAQAVQKLSAELGGKPQQFKADAAAQRPYALSQWTKGETVVQLIDRVEEDGKLPLVYVQKVVLDDLAKYRTNKPQEEGVSEEVQQATSRSGRKPVDNSQSPADAYTRKRRQQQ